MLRGDELENVLSPEELRRMFTQPPESMNLNQLIESLEALRVELKAGGTPVSLSLIDRLVLDDGAVVTQGDINGHKIAMVAAWACPEDGKEAILLRIDPEEAKDDFVHVGNTNDVGGRLGPPKILRLVAISESCVTMTLKEYEDQPDAQDGEG